MADGINKNTAVSQYIFKDKYSIIYNGKYYLISWYPEKHFEIVNNRMTREFFFNISNTGFTGQIVDLKKIFFAITILNDTRKTKNI